MYEGSGTNGQYVEADYYDAYDDQQYPDEQYPDEQYPDQYPDDQQQQYYSGRGTDRRGGPTQLEFPPGGVDGPPRGRRGTQYGTGEDWD